MPCPFILRSAPVEQYKEDIAALVAQLFEGIDGTVESRPGRGDRRRAARVPLRGCEQIQSTSAWSRRRRALGS
jgi:hypothetical protein